MHLSDQTNKTGKNTKSNQFCAKVCSIFEMSALGCVPQSEGPGNFSRAKMSFLTRRSGKKNWNFVEKQRKIKRIYNICTHYLITFQWNLKNLKSVSDLDCDSYDLFVPIMRKKLFDSLNQKQTVPQLSLKKTDVTTKSAIAVLKVRDNKTQIETVHNTYINLNLEWNWFLFLFFRRLFLRIALC